MKKRYSAKKDLVIISTITVAAIAASVMVMISLKESPETPATEVEFTSVETTNPPRISIVENEGELAASWTEEGLGSEAPRETTQEISQDSPSGSSPETSPETPAETSPEASPETPEESLPAAAPPQVLTDPAVLTKKEGAKEGYLNRCVFLGDSRTVAMVEYALINDDAALAQIGISHQAFASNVFMNNAGTQYTLSSYLASHQASVIYVALGVNGMDDPSEAHYKKTYRTLIDSIIKMAPHSDIVLMAIGPVDDSGPYKAKVQNAKVDKYNAFLLEVAKENNLYYLNIAEILKDSNGQLKSKYDGGDGLHYSKNGYEAVFKYIVEHPVPGVSDTGEYVVRNIPPDPSRMKTTTDKDAENEKNTVQEPAETQQEPEQTEEQEKTDGEEESEEEKEEENEENEEEKEEEEDKEEGETE